MAIRLNILQFRIADVVAIANVPQETIDQWVTQGHVSLDARPHGRETGLYTGSDVLKVCAAAELLRLGIAPSRSATGLAGDREPMRCLISTGAPARLGRSRPTQFRGPNRGRFLSVHTDDVGRRTWSVVHDPGPDTSDPGRIVIDCFKIGERVFPELMARLA